MIYELVYLQFIALFVKFLTNVTTNKILTMSQQVFSSNSYVNRNICANLCYNSPEYVYLFLFF